MADTAADALLGRLGENVNIGMNQVNVRNNLLKLVGEDAQKRIIEKNEAGSHIGEVELPPLEPIEQELA